MGLLQQPATVNALRCSSLHPAMACMHRPGGITLAQSWQQSSYRDIHIMQPANCIKRPKTAQRGHQLQSAGASQAYALISPTADCAETAAFMHTFDQRRLSSMYAALTDRYQQDISVFASLIRGLEHLVQQGKQLPETYLDRLCSYLRPLPDGAFLFEFLDLLLCFHAMEYTPQTTWLQQLDDAVLDCCTDPSSVNAPFLLSSQHAMAFMSLLCEDAERGLTACKGQSAAGIPIQACCVMAFPLLLESRMKGPHQQHHDYQVILAPVAVELGAQLDRYYTAVVAWYHMEGAAGGRNWWPVQHSLQDLLTARACVPLLTRLQPTLQHMDAGLDVVEDCIMFQQQSPWLLKHDAHPAYQELQECMCSAMQTASCLLTASAKQAQGSRNAPASNREHLGDVSQRATELCTVVIRSYLPAAAEHTHALGDILQALIALMLSVEVLNEATGTGPPWNMSDLLALDGYTADQTNPEVLVPALVMLSHHPGCWAPAATALHTPVRLLKVLGSEQLALFSYQQLVSTLQVLGCINQQAVAGAHEGSQEQASHGPAAEIHRLLQQEHWFCPASCTVRTNGVPTSGQALVKMDLLSLLGSRLAYLLARMTPDEQKKALYWMQ